MSEIEKYGQRKNRNAKIWGCAGLVLLLGWFSCSTASAQQVTGTGLVISPPPKKKP